MTSSRLLCLNPESVAPKLVAIPGGPGLSSHSLKGIETLTRSFCVYLVDPPGTGQSKKLPTNNFELLAGDLENAILEVPGPIVLLGHSFGGVLALDLALRGNVKIKAVVTVGTPISISSLKVDAVRAYGQHMTPALIQAANDFEARPSNETFRQWLANYGVLYFAAPSVQRGHDLLASDRVSSELFLALTGKLHPDPKFQERVRALRTRKIMIAGKEDRLLSVDLLFSEAQSADMEFVVVPDAGHYSFFDQPEQFAKAIEEAVLKKEART